MVEDVARVRFSVVVRALDAGAVPRQRAIGVVVGEGEEAVRDTNRHLRAQTLVRASERSTRGGGVLGVVGGRGLGRALDRGVHERGGDRVRVGIGLDRAGERVELAGGDDGEVVLELVVGGARELGVRGRARRREVALALGRLERGDEHARHLQARGLRVVRDSGRGRRGGRAVRGDHRRRGASNTNEEDDLRRGRRARGCGGGRDAEAKVEIVAR